jgi:hypothetical protein
VLDGPVEALGIFLYNGNMPYLRYALALLLTASLVQAASTPAPAHDTVSPPRVNERPVDDGLAGAPFVPVSDNELMGQINKTVDDYNAYQLASGGMETLTQVPEGSPPYR